jgi:hypothetical protein
LKRTLNTFNSNLFTVCGSGRDTGEDRITEVRCITGTEKAGADTYKIEEA